MGAFRGSRGYSFQSCQDAVKKFLERSNIHLPSELARREVYAFSYFFDRGAQAGLIPDEIGGAVLISEFRIAAEKGWVLFNNRSYRVFFLNPLPHRGFIVFWSVRLFLLLLSSFFFFLFSAHFAPRVRDRLV